MCGIFGSITKRDFPLSKKQAEKRSSIITGLALAMQSRGTNSTGIAGINRQFYSIYKDAIPAHKFIETKGFREVLDANYNIIIGHTRLATTGEVNKKNSHPFKYGNIIGVHNGHVSNYIHINYNLEVDSEAIFYLLDKYKGDYKKAFLELYGDFAIAWFDVDKPDKLHLVVDNNPLYLLYIDEIKTYFYCSENYPLQAITGSHFELGKKQKTWSPDLSQVYTIGTDLGVKKENVSFATSWRADGADNGYSGYHGRSGVDYEAREFDEAEAERSVNEQYGYNPDNDTPKTDIKVDKMGYEKRTGLQNPFKTAESQKDALLIDDVRKLDYKDMAIIVGAVEDKGCQFCRKKIDMIADEGCYWYSQVKSRFVVCLPCVQKTGLKFEYLSWIEPDDYSEILEEVDEYEELMKKGKKGVVAN